MRRIAERYADRVIITDDNPRNEAPEAIIQDIMRGCETNKVEVIHDRASAIEAAISQAKAGDYVVIAGKGHEDYQEINGVKWPFKDQEQVKKVLAVWGTLK
jgi:UDP-N-acetylmuramoyl-L-alanyl-D-glutamate--2,6-diaminopimelate ligase